MKEKLEISVKKALKTLSIEAESVSFEHPTEISHGDYSTNIALALSKHSKENPRVLAEKIVGEINKKLPKEIHKVEVAGAGFINFFLSKEFFVEQTAEILAEGQNFGRNSSLKKEKVVIEYTNPNPFKQFHIGHLMNNAIGESLSRIVDASGAKLTRVNYQGDVGLHVAKALYGMMHSSRPLPKEESLEKQIAYLGESYVAGATAYEENEEAKKEIQEINKKVFEKSDKEINKLYEWGRKISLEDFERLYQKLGTKFEHYFFESEAGAIGKKIVLEYLEKGVFEKSDGAIIFPGEKHALHTRVFINSQGLPTYEAKELGVSQMKYDMYRYDLSLVVAGNEINDYFKVLTRVIAILYPELADKIKHIPNGMLRLASGKMSSRKGNVILGNDLISDVEKLVEEKMKDRELPAGQKKEIVEKVAIGAIKYSILRQSPGKDIIFDLDKSLSFEGDSGPYLQYTAVRANSVLEKAKEMKIKSSAKDGEGEVNLVEKMLYRFPEIVELSLKEYAPQYIATYLIELAGAFNSYYGNTKIINTDPGVSYRLSLTEAVKIVLANGLNLLGIQVPEKM
ncbi:MAG: arginine--tRNA ligase [Candidatus Pacebacteria bacterium]|nr:arginine--tRNA ligase [Candidatus Paceibacterota bacterium]MDD5356935.1 arginine--tRNA ligase [Candidatus Paceibacterota bacterium]